MCPSNPHMSVMLPATTPEFRAAFDVIDGDGDSKISPDDLRAFYARPGLPCSAKEDDIEAMIAAADVNDDGFVEYDEFEMVLDKLETSAGVVEEIFRVMDCDGDGSVGFGDLKAFMLSAGFYISDEDVQAMITICGGDCVSCERLAKILFVV